MTLRPRLNALARTSLNTPPQQKYICRHPPVMRRAEHVAPGYQVLGEPTYLWRSPANEMAGMMIPQVSAKRLLWEPYIMNCPPRFVDYMKDQNRFIIKDR